MIFGHRATPATGTVIFTGQPGTVIPAGFVVLTEAAGTFPAIEFKTKERVQIGEDGTATAAVECLEPGTVGNVAAHTITLLSEPIAGLTSVINLEPFTGVN